MQERERDEFASIKQRVAESIHGLSKKQEERDNALKKDGRSVAVIKMGVEIQDFFIELDLQFAQMRDTLRRQRKNKKVSLY